LGVVKIVQRQLTSADARYNNIVERGSFTFACLVAMGFRIDNISEGIRNAAQQAHLNAHDSVTLILANDDKRTVEYKVKAKASTVGDVVAIPSHGKVVAGAKVSVIVSTVPDSTTSLADSQASITWRFENTNRWSILPLSAAKSRIASPDATDPRSAIVPSEWQEHVPSIPRMAVPLVIPVNVLRRWEEFETTIGSLMAYLGTGIKVKRSSRSGSANPSSCRLLQLVSIAPTGLILRLSTSGSPPFEDCRLRHVTGVILGKPFGAPSRSSSADPKASSSRPSGEVAGQLPRTVLLDQHSSNANTAVHVRIVSSDDFEALIAMLFLKRHPGTHMEWFRGERKQTPSSSDNEARVLEKIGLPAHRFHAIKQSVVQAPIGMPMTPLDIVEQHGTSLFHSMAALELLCQRQPTESAIANGRPYLCSFQVNVRA
jgi:hypothetical protein